VEQGWNFYVVGIVYNEQIMQNEISSYRRLFAVNIVLLAALFASFIAVVVYLLRKFEYQAYHDKLTGLANRKYFVEKFKKLKEKTDFSGNNIGIVFIDIDKFKGINDSYGHDIGDRVLENIAFRMENNLKETDITARMGGDEFVVALVDLDSKTKIIKVAKRLIKELKKPLIIDGQEIVIGISAGLSFYPDDSKVLEKLIKNADAAMYRAKRKDNDIESN
jgi:diguanylate cyclase (GGDEF)-like protein